MPDDGALIVLLGGGEVDADDLSEAMALGARCVAADGGADTALALGVEPELVIGDMDSLTPAARARLGPEKLRAIDEQDSTDFEKCLTRLPHAEIWALGFLGLRLDHTLACLSAMTRHSDKRVILMGSHDTVFAAPPEITLDLPVGSRLSLFPLAPVAGRGRGLRWPIDGIDFTPGGRIGTSNRVEGPVELVFESPGMVVLVDRAGRQAVRTGLARAGKWSAP